MRSSWLPEREAEVLRLMRSGQVRERDVGFEALVRELGPSLSSLCLGVTGVQADAEDALQETLATISRALPRFRGEARLGTWCYRIALRAALRIKARRARRAESPPPAELPSTRGASDEHDAQQLLAAVGRLPAEQRAVMLLFIEGRPHRQIAEILEIPEGTVWSRLHAARRQLRASL